MLRGYDDIIVASGSVPRMMPSIKGFDKALTFTQVLKDKVDVGDKVLFIGGGQSSCEAAYDMLLNFGKHPIIVEYAGDLVAAQATCLANTSFLRDAMEYHKVPVYLHSTVTEITDKGCTVKNVETGETTFVECDSVVNGIGFVPTPVGGKEQQEGLPRRRLRCHRQPAHGHLARMGRLHEDIVPKRQKISCAGSPAQRSITQTSNISSF